ncbi:MAG: hypothetical protein JW741_24165, partial [Sedimentisphaerales bacterium]|nr:hypothetical protein [Sedimentisphaerales bacterium]
MVLWIIRALFIVMVATIVILGGFFDVASRQSLIIGILGVLVVIVLGLTVDLLVRRKSLAALAGIFFGLLAGSLVGLSFNYIIEFLYRVHEVSPDSDLFKAKDGIMLIIQVLCCYLAIAFIMQTKDDFRFIIPYVEFSKQTRGGRPIVLDTSVIIDGRIADIATTGILDCPLIIPRFVLHELQVVADSADRSKRMRGRRGLDILNKLQSNKDLDLKIEDERPTRERQQEPVDQKLVSFAMTRGARIATNDFNLNKVASLRGAQVLNLHDLAGALRPVFLPGDDICLRLLRPGDQPGQAVGYLEDGTMVVVE